MSFLGIPFDPKITIGNVMQVLVIIVGMVFGYAMTVSRVDALEDNQDIIKGELNKQIITNKEIMTKLNDISNDQSWMRGRMEDQWGRGRGRQ